MSYLADQQPVGIYLSLSASPALALQTRISTLASYVSARDPDSGLQACVETELSPQPLKVTFKWCFLVFCLKFKLRLSTPRQVWPPSICTTKCIHLQSHERKP